MKKISVCVPCFNEEGNVDDAYRRITDVMRSLENRYDYEIIFADNDSQDDTRPRIRSIAAADHRVKALFNAQNVGVERSGNNCVYSATGDAVVVVPCDMQEPPELIPEFVDWWEQGWLIVMGQKVASENKRFDRGLRRLYYKIIDKFSDVPQYEQVTGFGLMDRQVVDTFNAMREPVTEMRHLFAECGFRVKLVPYTQAARTAGKSSYGFWSFMDHGILSLCTTSRKPLRLMTLLGCVASIVLLIIGIVYLVLKLTHWDSMQMGSAPVLLGVFFIGAVQLFCFGLLGEYIGIISERSKSRNRPLAIVEERINFDS